MSTASASAAGSHVRFGSAPSHPAGSSVVGALPSASQLSLTVTLKPRDAAALQRYADEVSTPGSSLYHQYLTVDQFRQAFGRTTAELRAVGASLRAHGLRPGAASANGLSIPVTASAGRVAHAFSLSFNRVKVRDGRTAFANTSAPLVDASIAGELQGILGLDSLAVARPVSLHSAGAHAAAAPHVVTGGPQPCSSASGAGARTADQIASAYRFSSLYGASDLGAGQTVALFELEPNSTSDISAYQSCYGTSATVTYVKVDGGSGTGSGQGEAALDIEDVIGLAPKAAVRVYQGPNSNAGVYDTYNSIASQNTAKAISTSWGLCESSEGSSAANSESTLFQEMATQGQSIFAASGDSGSEDCGTRTLAVDDPASQPYVTGVGGTTLSALGPPPTQSVWNNSIGAGGGGVSTLWAMPSYQSGAPSSLNVVNANSSATPCHASSGYCREVPDVSVDADPNTGYAIDYKGSWIAIGGTSAAAPTWASFAALVNASSTCAGAPIGFANAALYKAAGSAYAADFSDVTSGNNDFKSQNSGKFPAGTAYDMATGLGSPVGSTLPSTLCGGGGGGGGGNTVTVTSPGNQTSTVGTVVSLTVHATDSGGAALTYSATGLPAGLSINASTGAISGTPTTAGTSSVTVTARDSTGASGSASFTWTVNPAGGGGCTAKQLLGNPGFETGSAAPWSATSGVIQPSSAGQAAHAGSYVAWMDGYGRAHTDTLSQSVAIPSGCTSYAFSYWLHIDTAETTTSTQYDKLSVQVLNSSGTVLATLATFSNLNKASGYQQHSSSLAAWAGQTVTIKFTGTEDSSLQTSFVVDDTALNVS